MEKAKGESQTQPMAKPGRFDYRFKCMDCNLHFQVHTWNEDWVQNHNAYCPECGSQGAKITWRAAEKEFIFQAVPGVADLVGMGT